MTHMNCGISALNYRELRSYPLILAQKDAQVLWSEIRSFNM